MLLTGMWLLIGTTDYFNECSVPMGVPNNFNGKQASNFGSGYAGLYFLAPNDYREYIQGELSETLIKGKRYTVSFYVSLAEKSSFAIKDISVLFSEKKMQIGTKKRLKLNSLTHNNDVNFVQISSRQYYGDKANWMQVSREFVAKGTENYLTIGNFRDNANTKTKRIAGGFKSATYYYVDMVSVTSDNRDFYFDNLKLNQVYVLGNVLFTTDMYRLNDMSKVGLDELYKQLKKDSTLYISVHAHTDNDGTSNYNKDLSEKRAMSVARYLISLGLNSRRIQWFGHGGKIPIAENRTQDGKKKNRRAEFVVTRNPFNAVPSTITETLFEDDMP